MQNFAQNADAQDAAAARAARDIKPCACGNFAVAETGERLHCGGETLRTFAPGHDARLKGFLIRAGRQGQTVKVLGEDEPISPLAAANRYGFGHMVAEGIARPVRKKAAKKTAPKPVTAKVGRWTYEGFVSEDGTMFSYQDKQGNHKIAERFAIQAG